jgi:hypothetical protein
VLYGEFHQTTNEGASFVLRWFHDSGRTFCPERPFTVEVDYTDRTRADDGDYNVSTRTVEVLAHDEDEASLIGIQLVTAMRDEIGGMPLAARVIL